jgi:hypothetical protein
VLNGSHGSSAQASKGGHSQLGRRLDPLISMNKIVPVATSDKTLETLLRVLARDIH